MCRISPQHLTNFWPVILAELVCFFFCFFLFLFFFFDFLIFFGLDAS